MTSYGLLTILDERAEEKSFHVASEKHVRVEFMRFTIGQKLGPLTFEGDAIVTCLEGAFLVGEKAQPIGALWQVIFPGGEALELSCASESGAIQIIWAPPFPRTA
jgi:hypothetical protein